MSLLHQAHINPLTSNSQTTPQPQAALVSCVLNKNIRQTIDLKFCLNQWIGQKSIYSYKIPFTATYLTNREYTFCHQKIDCASPSNLTILGYSNNRKKENKKDHIDIGKFELVGVKKNPSPVSSLLLFPSLAWSEFTNIRSKLIYS